LYSRSALLPVSSEPGAVDVQFITVIATTPMPRRISTSGNHDDDFCGGVGVTTRDGASGRGKGQKTADYKIGIRSAGGFGLLSG